MTAKIDWGNRELGLDLIPRNDAGEVMDAESSSVMELFRVHQKVPPWAWAKEGRGREGLAGPSSLPR